MIIRLLAAALVLAFLGLLLVVLSKRGRWLRGLGSGQTLALDDVTLYSERLGANRETRSRRLGLHSPATVLVD